jgi:hypothetical protein
MASGISSTPPPPPPPSPPGGLNGTDQPNGGLNGTGQPNGGLNGTSQPPADVYPPGRSDPAEQVLSGLGSIAGSIGSAIQDDWDQAGEEFASGVNDVVDGMTDAIFGSS